MASLLSQAFKPVTLLFIGLLIVHLGNGLQSVSMKLATFSRDASRVSRFLPLENQLYVEKSLFLSEGKADEIMEFIKWTVET